jgi:hypothetical protein
VGWVVRVEQRRSTVLVTPVHVSIIECDSHPARMLPEGCY